MGMLSRSALLLFICTMTIAKNLENPWLAGMLMMGSALLFIYLGSPEDNF